MYIIFDYAGVDLMKSSVLRTAKYVQTRDGTALSTYVFSKKPLDMFINSPRPLIWSFDRYHSISPNSSGFSQHNLNLNESSDVLSLRIVPKHLQIWLTELLDSGYLVAFVDVRGSGASFGFSNLAFGPEEALDAYDIIESFSSESWCNGRIGMFGRSYKGITQLFAGIDPHPNLKALCPEMAYGDLYAFAYSGGIFRDDFIYHWTQRVRDLDLISQIEPVDADTKSEMVTQARLNHFANRNNFEAIMQLRFRDSNDLIAGEQVYSTRSPLAHREKISQSNIPMFHITGWFDLWIKDALLMFVNFSNFQQLIIGPWAHGGCEEKELANLHIKWFDNWLKNSKSNNDYKRCIHYFTIGETTNSPWKKTSHWPPQNQIKKNLYLTNSDSLDENPTIEGNLKYTVNPTCSSGTATRWTNGYGGEFGYPDMRENEAKSICFTSEKLTKPLEITGHPIVSLWISSPFQWIDCFVYLSDVYIDGFSQYITEGQLKLSNRKLSHPPYENFGLPYHSGLKKDILAPCYEPEEVIIDLFPTSYVIPKDHRIRISINSADIDNAELTQKNGEFTVYFGKKHPSHICLPTISSE